jgi:very-short-patch-repair endonuclease
MRRNPTEAERKLWRHLRNHSALSDIGTHFRKQVPLGDFIADFASHKAGLVVEVDGGQHGEQTVADAKRTKYLERDGYRVLRFWNTDVMNNIEGVLEEIFRALTPTPTLSPQGGEE